MKNILKHIVFILMVSLGSHSFAQEILLPDQVFTIKVIEKNTDGRYETMPADELILKANQISSTFSTKNGFPGVPYTVTQQAAPNSFMLDFTAVSTNGKNDILKWTGTINGTSVIGKAERIRNGKPAGEYTFTGTRKKKK